MNARDVVAALVLVIAFIAGSAMDGPEIDQAEVDRINTAIKERAAKARFEKAAHAMCGNNAAWEEVAPGTVQCYLHTGRKASVVRVSQ